MKRTIQEAARTMIKGVELLEVYWKEEIHIETYTLNRILYGRKYGKTSYELWYVRTLIVKYFKVFGNKCYSWRDEDNLEKLDSK